jgi:O-antigen/teichoic acid export membrane protein
MQRKFITNLALLLLLNLLIKPFWILGIDRAVQNAVSPADYGLFYALFNFSFLFNILLDFGITNFNNKNIAQNNHLLNKHLSGIIILRIMLAFVYLLVTIN